MWASRPGRAEKKNPATGIKINSKGINIDLQTDTPRGLFGLYTLSMKNKTKKKPRERVKIMDDNFGTINPNTVLPKAGLISVGNVSPIVIINQLTGHKMGPQYKSQPCCFVPKRNIFIN